MRTDDVDRNSKIVQTQTRRNKRIRSRRCHCRCRRNLRRRQLLFRVAKTSGCAEIIAFTEESFVISPEAAILHFRFLVATDNDVLEDRFESFC